MLKKVVIIGPESTGKSTLAQQLAAYFQCPWVPEFAREYLDALDRSYTFGDLLPIAKGQLDSEDQLAEQAKNILICDTDLHVIKVWSEHKYGKLDAWVDEQVQKRVYDLYLLTAIDIPWEEDPMREHPDPAMREYFWNLYLRLIAQTGIPYEVIAGDMDVRLEKSINAIEHVLKE
ncbi:AAA family ATPase [Mongoliitalea daihaiensis]|uniref:AAA family ATPase n=1 Tax=Mongoliitalea daihaiensis TaxID=2782006 RepID=UPI001F272B09|nr:ATP-binding protein [Mongoliitalea daihaiensis]UJP66108.1 ATP-binding protein [Mongoliitalea daihaiensis]